MSGQGRRIRTLVACLTALCLLTAPAVAGARGKGRTNHRERAVAKQINHLRAARGLPKLRISHKLGRAADLHSRDMLRADFFAHPSSNGQSTYARVSTFLMSALIGEVLAYVPKGGHRSPRAVVRMWKRSPGHLAVLTTKRFRRIGVAKRKGTLFGWRVTVWTADVASRR